MVFNTCDLETALDFYGALRSKTYDKLILEVFLKPETTCVKSTFLIKKFLINSTLLA